jgi:hypothetical protein
MRCEECGKEHDGSYGSGRFCSENCRRVFCGKQSNKKGKLNCPRKKVVRVNNNSSNNSSNDEYICSYCGRTCKNDNSLRNHERLCKLNPNRDIRSYEILRSNTEQYNAAFHKGTREIWNKGLNMSTDERVRQYALTLRNRYESGELKPTFKGRQHSETSKSKSRESTFRYLEKTKGGARYNIDACKYFDSLNAERGWNLIHALNGGEFKVGRYYVDAYDANLNIVVEYDEPRHHLKGTRRNEKDIVREQYIKDTLHCTFYRFSVLEQKLYEI